MKKRNAFPETMKVAVLSTTHMTEADSKLLAEWDRQSREYKGVAGLIVDGTPYGWYVHISSDDTLPEFREKLESLGVSEGFQKVMLTAKRTGFQKVNFDQDGLESDTFPKYEW